MKTSNKEIEIEMVISEGERDRGGMDCVTSIQV